MTQPMKFFIYIYKTHNQLLYIFKNTYPKLIVITSRKIILCIKKNSQLFLCTTRRDILKVET
jgi:hypothetical protein